jgi:polyferredoxin
MANVLALAGPGSKYRLPGALPAGFLAGLWHGLICPITFIVSLFNPGIRIYEVKNCGAWYDFGFVLGVSASFGGGAAAGPAGR